MTHSGPIWARRLRGPRDAIWAVYESKIVILCMNAKFPSQWMAKYPRSNTKFFRPLIYPFLAYFGPFLGLPEADYHSPNLPMVIYHAIGVRHIRWNISRNPSLGFIGVGIHIGGLWPDRWLIEKRLWGPKGPKVFFRRTCSLVRATTFFRGGGGREKRPDGSSKDFFIR